MSKEIRGAAHMIGKEGGLVEMPDDLVVPQQDRKDTPKRIEVQQPRLPEVVDGRYDITTYLGGGGMGDAFLARKSSFSDIDDPHDAEFVIKMIKPEFLQEDGEESEMYRARFQREITSQAASEKVSPYVVEVVDTIELIDAGSGERTVGIVMPRMEDGDLGNFEEEILEKEGEINDGFLAEIGIEIAKALKGIHEAGYVHRDLKIDNVFVNKNPFFVKLGDFGLAKSLELIHEKRDPLTRRMRGKKEKHKGDITQDSVVTGTPQYMSPESLRGENVGIERDLYALGITLYALRAGVFPFEDDYRRSIAQGMRAQMEQNPPPIKEAMEQWFIQEGVFDNLIETLIQRNPSHRRMIEIAGEEYEIDTAEKIEKAIKKLVEVHKLTLPF